MKHRLGLTWPTTRTQVPRLFAVTLCAALFCTRGFAEEGRAKPANAPSTAPAAGWRSLFNGKDLTDWKSSDFGGEGDPAVEDGKLMLPAGVGLTGVTYKGAVPTMNYEVSIEAERIDGADFFCGLTFPVGKAHATLVVGGWGGSLVGISSLNGDDAAHNETRTNRKFESKKWYTIRLRVLPDRLVAFVGDDKVVDVSTKGKEISVRRDIENSVPFGIASWQTSAALKNIRVRDLTDDEAAGK